MTEIDIAARLSRATGPDRELDDAIVAARAFVETEGRGNG